MELKEERYNLNQKRHVYRIVFDMISLESTSENAHKWAWYARSNEWVMDGYYRDIWLWEHFIKVAKKEPRKNPWDIWNAPESESKEPPNEPSDDEDIINKIKEDD